MLYFQFSFLSLVMEDLILQDDRELLSSLRKGDESALNLIYAKYWQPLFTSAYNFLKDKEACEDIIQEIFIKIWNKRESIEYTVSLKAYLYASVRYEVYRQVRAGNVRESIFENIAANMQTLSDQHILEHKELLSKINSIVDQLPQKCKEVYQLSRVEQLSHKEIAEKLNISTKTVENHMTKALKVLRTSLGDVLTIGIISHFIK